MNYVVYYKDTLKVYKFVNSENVKLTNDLAIARCENIPQGDKFTVTNLQSKTEKYTVEEPKEVVKTDEQGNEYTETEYIEVEKEREYQTCELVGEVDNKKKTLARIGELKAKLKAYDYIGVKIATGRATKEEYANEIAEMTAWANEINELERVLL
jgi:hypothetical protein